MTGDNRLHVVWVTTGLGSGGAEMMQYKIVAAGDALRFRHSVISLTAGGKYVEKLEALGVEVITLGMKPGRPGPLALLRLVRAVWRLKPDVLMGWMYHGDLVALVARWFLRKPVPVIANVRQSLDSLADEKRGSAMVIRLLAKLSKRFEAIVYNSQRSAVQHEGFGFDAIKTALIPNGVDTAGFNPSEEARTALRAELGLDSQTLIVGRVGRNHPMKDIPTFLDAAGLVAAESPEVRFVLAGAGMDESDETLAARIAKPDLAGRVHLLGERHDLPQLTAAFDVACSSSAFGEGFPNVIAEAMACAVPCVATDVGDTAFVLGEGGVTVPPKDAAALARELRRMLKLSRAERMIIGESGRRRVLNDFSLTSAVGSFEKLFMRGGTQTAAIKPEKSPCAA